MLHATLVTVPCTSQAGEHPLGPCMGESSSNVWHGRLLLPVLEQHRQAGLHLPKDTEYLTYAITSQCGSGQPPMAISPDEADNMRRQQQYQHPLAVAGFTA